VSGYFRFFYTILKSNHTKILHVHFGYHGVKLVGLKKKLNIPMVCSFYGDDVFAHPRKGNNAKKYLRLFSNLDKALVLGTYMKAELIRLGCPDHKITIHHLGIDVDKINFVKRSVAKRDKIRFLIAASFLPKKGITLAIKALTHFKDSYDFTLDIIGDGILKDEIVNTIEQSGLKDRITLHGYKPYDYFIDLTYSADVFIQASLTTKSNNKEGTPMAIVDAMASGMAIIATKHSDIPEIVTDNEQGYLAEENNVESLVTCFSKIFNNPEKIETFSINARQKVEKEFNAQIQTMRLEEYYTDLLSNHE
jgi:colanic acid/amylovoran biosynthesis glycosyltransferase